MSRARIKPVRAWALMDYRGHIFAATCAVTRKRLLAEWSSENMRAIQVVVRPVPRRRAKKSRRKDK